MIINAVILRCDAAFCGDEYSSEPINDPELLQHQAVEDVGWSCTALGTFCPNHLPRWQPGEIALAIRKEILQYHTQRLDNDGISSEDFARLWLMLNQAVAYLLEMQDARDLNSPKLVDA